MHLKYLMLAAQNLNVSGHPQEVLRELGITYSHSTPQSMLDQWWFWNCKDIPDPLPSYLIELDADPVNCIGLGLDKTTANQIKGLSEIEMD